MPTKDLLREIKRVERKIDSLPVSNFDAHTNNITDAEKDILLLKERIKTMEGVIAEMKNSLIEIRHDISDDQKQGQRILVYIGIGIGLLAIFGPTLLGKLLP